MEGGRALQWSALPFYDKDRWKTPAWVVRRLGIAFEEAQAAPISRWQGDECCYTPRSFPPVTAIQWYSSVIRGFMRLEDLRRP